jgi:hypothetical protein
MEIKISLDDSVFENIEPNKFYNMASASEILKLDHQTIKYKITRKQLRPLRHRKFEHYRFLGSELLKFLQDSDEYETSAY